VEENREECRGEAREEGGRKGKGMGGTSSILQGEKPLKHAI